jgi:excisionase family DNA binding protein
VTANGNGNGQDPELMTRAEVAALFRVHPKTVTRWARAGKLSPIRTLGGHRRYKTAELRALLAAARPCAPPQPAGEPDLGDIARDHPRWRCWQGVSGNLYARLPRSSPPIIVRAPDPASLRKEICRADAGPP